MDSFFFAELLSVGYKGAEHVYFEWVLFHIMYIVDCIKNNGHMIIDFNIYLEKKGELTLVVIVLI